MSFVIYNVKTTFILRKHWYDKPYETEAAAKAGLTRALKKDSSLKRKDFAISDTINFHKNIEKKVIKHNLMSKKPFEIAVNEPLCVDPSSETYWSM